MGQAGSGAGEGRLGEKTAQDLSRCNIAKKIVKLNLSSIS